MKIENNTYKHLLGFGCKLFYLNYLHNYQNGGEGKKTMSVNHGFIL